MPVGKTPSYPRLLERRGRPYPTLLGKVPGVGIHKCPVYGGPSRPVIQSTTRVAVFVDDLFPELLSRGRRSSQDLPWGAFFWGSGVYLLQPFVVG